MNGVYFIKIEESLAPRDFEKIIVLHEICRENFFGELTCGEVLYNGSNQRCVFI